MNKTLFAAMFTILALVAFMIAVGVFVTLSSCTSFLKSKPTLPDFRTSYDVGIITNGYKPDLNEIDVRYLKMMRCTGVAPPKHLDNFIVVIGGKNTVPCPSKKEPNRRCEGGEYNPNTNPPTITIPENIGGFAHELGHFLLHYERSLIGFGCHHQCCPPINCGTYIDNGRGPAPRCRCVIESGAYKVIYQSKDVCEPGIVGKGLLL